MPMGGLRPWKLITTDDPTKPLRAGTRRHFGSLLGAANAFAADPAPFRTVIYDDGCHARELSAREQQFVDDVCDLLGLEVRECP